MMKFDVLVVNANPLLNLVHANDYTPGAINRVQSMHMAAEGKGVNVARVLARHCHRVALTGFAGGHSGAWLRELISAESVKDELIETAAPLRVGFMASGPDSSHPTTVLPAGFPVTQAECQALLDRVESLLVSVRLVIGSGSVPDPVADDLYARLLELCQKHSVPCWLDAYGHAMMLALEGPVPPKVCTPNRQEFDQCRHWDRVEELHITDGDAPIKVSSLYHGQWRVIPPTIKQVNPVGSGDCYVAGLAHGWLLGLPWQDCLRYAASAGTVNASRQDVAMIAPFEVNSLQNNVRVECICKPHG